MTFLALGPDVATGQREAGLGMIERRIFPVPLVVAGFAFLAELIPVFVVLLVAGIALDLQLLGERAFFREMAVIAFGAEVLALEFIPGVAGMIEGDGFPILLGMAALALRAVTPLVTFVLVIFLVAGIT